MTVFYCDSVNFSFIIQLLSITFYENKRVIKVTAMLPALFWFKLYSISTQ